MLRCGSTGAGGHVVTKYQDMRPTISVLSPGHEVDLQRCILRGALHHPFPCTWEMSPTAWPYSKDGRTFHSVRSVDNMPKIVDLPILHLG